MFDITLLAIGKIKEKYFVEAISEYTKRLKPYANLKILELAPVSFNNTNREKAKIEEGRKIVGHLEKNKEKYIIILDEHGLDFTSHQFAKYLQELNRPVVFVIGGALGLSQEVLECADYTMALSQFTFPHELARLVLVEQIYRAATIASNKTYHY
jgi:23S rRNA (pseudouridine1915-N3)-methyltransferase